MSAVTCAACGAENGERRKFCGDCGAALTLPPPRCPACGTEYEGSERFCGECGAPRGESGVAAPAATPSPRAVDPTGPAELRQVTVLFVDLVGYTALSETRDSEDVRELLSGYFETARTIVGRYGGTIEKFIGDAVMAVWGSPVAREDDAERAVRAALDLVAAVPVFGGEAGVPTLAARAGVVTGQAASVVDPRQGLVVGDRVNTASRVQSAAAPGTVLVDEVTRGATSAAVAYADAGEHQLKGKAEPLHLWQATRVVAGVGGKQRVDGLEAGFVGRDTELALVKELFHATLDRSTARLVTVVGLAGVGKSRLLWEFDKYSDGISHTVLWHKGRCLSYGDGVAYWALAEMVRQRFGIAEEDASDIVTAKMLDGLGTYVADPAERDFLIPRVGRLLGLDDAEGFSREELFSGWRLLVERLSQTNPVVLVIEDLQWADTGLLDFLEHLLDWSGQHPVFVLALARPDLLERRPSWGSGRRNATTVYLEPLSPAAVNRMLEDLVPGMPSVVRDRITAQSEGIPLYAVETVRALIDRDQVVPRDGVYTLVADVADLAAIEVPATLTSLIAARLDALPPDARALVRELSVFGGSFPRSAVGAITGRDDEQVETLLAELVHRDVLTVRADPLSPQRGQYAFTQAMLRTVAHDTLSKRERKSLHLAAATQLRSTIPDDGDEMIDAIAAHYREALEAGPEDEDADAVQTLAKEAYLRAGDRAERLGAPAGAQAAFEAAAALTADPGEAAALLGRAGRVALLVSRPAARRLLGAAGAAHERAGNTREAARFRALAAGTSDDVAPALAEMREALAVLSEEPLDDAFAEVAARLGSLAWMTAWTEVDALALFDRALEVAEALELPEIVSAALLSKGLIFQARGRETEATALYTFALTLALEQGQSARATVAYGNLVDALLGSDRPGVAEKAHDGLALARRLGDRSTEEILLSNLWLHQVWTGEWSAVESACAQLIAAGNDFPDVHARLALLLAWRGDVSRAEQHLPAVTAWLDATAQDRAIAQGAFAAVRLAHGQAQEALTLVEDVVNRPPLGLRHETFRVAWPTAVEAALALGRVADAERLLAAVGDKPPGHVPPYLRGQLARLGALIRIARGEARDVEPDLRRAAEAFRGLGHRYWQARTELDLGEWLVAARRPDDAAAPLASAAEIFGDLVAPAWSGRVDAARARRETSRVGGTTP